MAISISKPTVGGSQDTWGQQINDALDVIVNSVNGTAGQLATPDLEQGAFKIGCTVITVTGAELNVLDGDTSAISTTVEGTDSIVFNDGGTMKQVSLADIATYIATTIAGANNSTITVSAGNGMTTGGSFTINQSSDQTITIDHQDTSSQSSVNNSGSTYIQDITLDGFGHVTGITSTDASANISGAPKAVTAGVTGSAISLTNVLNGDVIVAFLGQRFTSNTSEFVQIWDQDGWVGFNPSSTQLASGGASVRWQNTGGTKDVYIRGQNTNTSSVGRVVVMQF